MCFRLGFLARESTFLKLFVCAVLPTAAAPPAAQRTLRIIAGSGEPGYGGDGGPAAAARLAFPEGVAADVSGNIYIADFENHRVRRVDRAGRIATVAGTGQHGFSGDGGPATAARLAFPSGVAADSAGNLYIADEGNRRVRRVDARGNIATIAGAGEESTGAAQPIFPSGVAVDGAGNVYIADDENHRVLRVDRAGKVTAVAGSGEPGYGGDGGPAAAARLYFPVGAALDDAGNLYIADRSNHRIRKVDRAGIMTTVAGSGEPGFDGDGGPATAARLRFPGGAAVDSAGNLYVADSGNDRIRRVDAKGKITTIAGPFAPGNGGNNARPLSPAGIAVDAASNIYIAEDANHLIRLLAASPEP